MTALPISSDETFDALFPEQLNKAVAFHFTPIAVAEQAAKFLVNAPQTKVLDIGAGAGKFCMIGASFTPGHFTGVEIRTSLFETAQALKQQFQIKNVTYRQANITAIDFSEFDAFYHFNAFYEHIDPSGEIDDSMPLDKSLFKIYSQYVKEQLDGLPIGTRLATYFSYGDEIPESYQVVSTAFDGKLVLREKKF